MIEDQIGQVNRRLKASHGDHPHILLLIALAVLLAGSCAASPETADAAYRTCKKEVRIHRAPYSVAVQRMRCRPARRTARVVLVREHAPGRWRCDLALLDRGIASCRRRTDRRGKARFVVWPMRSNRVDNGSAVPGRRRPNV